MASFEGDILLDEAGGETLLGTFELTVPRYYDDLMTVMVTNKRLIIGPDYQGPHGKKPYLKPALQAVMDPETYLHSEELAHVRAVRKPDFYLGVIGEEIYTNVLELSYGDLITMETREQGVIEEFQRVLKEAMSVKKPLVRLPEGERILYSSSETGFFPYMDAAFRELYFMGTNRVTFAITNKRLLFYRVNHVDNIHPQPRVTFGQPRLQFFSIPHDRIVQTLNAGEMFRFMIKGEIQGFEVPGLFAYDDIKYVKDSYACGKCGKTIEGSMFYTTLMGRLSPPEVRTGIKCNGCGSTICRSCEVKTTLGIRCPVCGKSRKNVAYIDPSYERTSINGEAQAQVKPVGPRLGTKDKEWALDLCGVMLKETIMPALKIMMGP